MIDSFEGPYDFLSNFYPAVVRLKDDGCDWPFATVEHAFQAAKTNVEAERIAIWGASSPGRAKKLGRKCTLRADWEQVRLDVMLDLLREKFSDVSLSKMLISTGDEELVEGNWWGDNYWGTVNGVGENHLGKLLMKVRDELRQS